MLVPLGKGVTSFAFASTHPNPGNLPASMPREWLRLVAVQVDARAGRKAQAFALADKARIAVLSLPWQEWDGGIITAVECADGPFWLPDDDGAPRYVARYDVWAHPRPESRTA